MAAAATAVEPKAKAAAPSLLSVKLLKTVVFAKPIVDGEGAPEMAQVKHAGRTRTIQLHEHTTVHAGNVVDVSPEIAKELVAKGAVHENDMNDPLSK